MVAESQVVAGGRTKTIETIGVTVTTVATVAPVVNIILSTPNGNIVFVLIKHPHNWYIASPTSSDAVEIGGQRFLPAYCSGCRGTRLFPAYTERELGFG